MVHVAVVARRQLYAALRIPCRGDAGIIGRWNESWAAPDVVVIGGGIIGSSAAAHLAEAGRRVVLVERAEIGAGASGRNSGVVQHPFDPVLVELHLETLALYRELEGFALPAEPAGLLSVTHDVDGARRSRPPSSARRTPICARRSSRRTSARSIEPALASGVAACRLDIGYPVAPAAATRAYAARAERAASRSASGAGQPWLDDGRACRRAWSTATSASRPGTVVVAAGPWTPASSIRPASGGRSSALGCRRRRRRSQAPPRHVLEEAEIEIEPAAEDDGRSAGHAFSLVTADGVELARLDVPRRRAGPGAVRRSSQRGARFVPGDRRRAAVGPSRLCARPAEPRRPAARRPRARASTGCGSRPAMARGGSRPAGVGAPARRPDRPGASRRRRRALDPARFGRRADGRAVSASSRRRTGRTSVCDQRSRSRGRAARRCARRIGASGELDRPSAAARRLGGPREVTASSVTARSSSVRCGSTRPMRAITA